MITSVSSKNVKQQKHRQLEKAHLVINIDHNKFKIVLLLQVGRGFRNNDSSQNFASVVVTSQGNHVLKVFWYTQLHLQ